MQGNDVCTGMYSMDSGSQRSGVGGTRGGGKVCQNSSKIQRTTNKNLAREQKEKMKGERISKFFRLREVSDIQNTRGNYRGEL